MCTHDNQFHVTLSSINAFYEAIEEQHRERMRRLEAYQQEMAARDAQQADRMARTKFLRMFRIRQALYRWAPSLAGRLML